MGMTFTTDPHEITVRCKPECDSIHFKLIVSIDSFLRSKRFAECIKCGTREPID